MRYFCCDERRRVLVLGHPALNGIDFLEVLDRDAPAGLRQRLLVVRFLKPPTGALAALTPDNVTIEGGVRIRDIGVEAAAVAADVLQVRVDTPGDFSTYTLRIGGPGGEPLPEMDPLLSAVDFSFKVECPSDFDCAPASSKTGDERAAPEIDYLAKDYDSFRGLMLDRLRALVPGWTETNPADLGIVLVELLAYVGDYLSYTQDAVATEAYLGTALHRASVRRHARLVDYPMHDGCNARAWVRVDVMADGLLPAGTQLLTRVPGIEDRIAPDSPLLREAFSSGPEVFETLHDAALRTANGTLFFHTWGDDECCLPKGATRATLRGRLETLAPGDVLIFAEVVAPHTGREEDADPSHRHPVRLTSVAFAHDPLFESAPGSGTPLEVTQIEWAPADALPFPLCLWEVDGRASGVAWGNIVLADHGRTFREPLGAVPPPDPRLAPVSLDTCDACSEEEPLLVPGRFRPRLQSGPLTMAAAAPDVRVPGDRQRAAFDPAAPAASALQWDMADVLPQASLIDTAGRTWIAQRDLLGSDEFAPEFVAEVDDAGRATLRFGDDEYGLRPAAGLALDATYRTGNGTRGNVGADSIRHIVRNDDGILGVTNPLPASGGTDPEPLEAVRQNAPQAFRVPQRAVTPEDYAEMAQRHPEVQRAAATIRWTGSWRTIFLTVDRVGGRPVDAAFEADLRGFLERFRMAGHDLEVDGPRYVDLELEVHVCVDAQYYRGDVRAALLEALGSGTQRDGTRGFFHPDNFTFGQPVYLSPIYSAVQQVPGVRFAEVTTLQRLGQPGREALDLGLLSLGRLEIARLANDPSFPERGVLRLTLDGGR